MYKLTKHNSIQRLSDNASIPPDPANRDYAEYLEWVAAGNNPEPADQPSLSQVAATKLEELRKKRNEASSADVVVAGNIFTAEPETQTGFKRLGDRLRRGRPSSLQAILDNTGTPVAVNLALLEAIEDAIAANTEAAWIKYGQLVQEVKAATTVESINAIVW
jgi:hypothetical protein